MIISIVCEACENEIDVDESQLKKLKLCPHCGAELPKTEYKKPSFFARLFGKKTQPAPAPSGIAVVEQTDKDFKIDKGVLEKYVGKGGEVTVPDGVKKIGDAAFENCADLRAIQFPDSLERIGSRAFYACSNLTELVFPNRLQEIGDAAFENCAELRFLQFPDSLKIIGASAFYCCENLTELKLPNGLKRIGNSAFAYCDSLSEITVPDSVIHIGFAAFQGCRALTAIVLPFVANERERYGCFGNIFGADTLEENKAYVPRKLASVTLTNAKHVGREAFYNCKSITRIDLPKSLEALEVLAFLDCTNLKTIRYHGTKKEFQAVRCEDSWASGVQADGVTCNDGKLLFKNYLR
ncbi:MAG: leucine-rich repeat protein [Clostridia bacterium]|nr:leucine-rich repeat protein [Clostridia bacterium]